MKTNLLLIGIILICLGIFLAILIYTYEQMSILLETIS